jgi:hypothetical protein
VCGWMAEAGNFVDVIVNMSVECSANAWPYDSFWNFS